MSLNKDFDVLSFLDISPRTLRRLMSLSDAVGIDAPCVGGGKLRRWYGGESEWLRWFGEVTKCLRGSKSGKNTAQSVFAGSFAGNVAVLNAPPPPKPVALPLKSRRHMRAASSGDPETTI